MDACATQRFSERIAMQWTCVALVCVQFFLLLTGALAVLLLPEASGTTVYDKKGTTVDASHADQGYILVKQEATDKKLKMRISLGQYSMTYDLNSNGEYEVFPLQLGDGKYKVQVFSQISGKKYDTVSSISFSAKLENALSPYLYPNQYVNYNADSQTVKKAQELCQGLNSDEEKFKAVYQFVVTHMVYDYIFALNVESGYLPVVDNTLASNKGICFDFAALVACMLRSQGIPTQLVIGYADKTYHAWNMIYLNDNWVRCDATSDICATNVQTYTTERYY